MPANDLVPILVNRESKSDAYWDDPLNMLARGAADLRLVDFFDWDELGYRDFRYARVRIVEWSAQPRLLNRYALIEFPNARFHVVGGEA